MMLTGSRLGAAFVVLVTAVIYAFRGGRGKRWAPVSTAIITLSATALIAVPAAVVGSAILSWDRFHALEVHAPVVFVDLIDATYGGIVARAEELPAGAVFIGGLAVLLVSFKIIDSVLPQLDDQSLSGSRSRWLQRKWPMFGLGCLVALVTMSVSIALAVLVPLVTRKYVQRDAIIPYIMGANITTLGDTMVAAFALDSPAAVRIVLAHVIATTVLSVLILAFLYEPTRRAIWWFQRQFMESRARLACFTAALFAIPVTIILVAGTVA
jgi:sodium-dependent phosphate cotransporter